ncbi:hypothetical protein U9M48_044502 [Paspalum notatum var. saurae]|uniref:Retrotransposon gag domain-containing protein n=1 Tax=Paspalum notatum var. saurae TaxID=547442 RepID=A0AAQ3UV94_PASNO
MPQLCFPQFDGTNPKLWISRCETFFDVYDVGKQFWVKLASMHFVGSAAFWLQSVQASLPSLSWEEFGLAICNRFDRDEHNHLLRQFFHVEQNQSSVSEYIECFSELLHQLLVHDPSFPPSAITNRFVDGLKPSIKAVEEAVGVFQLKEYNADRKRPELFTSQKKFSASLPELRSTPETSRFSDEKLSALKSYRRAKGLCYKCGEKWGPSHKCPSSVSLHAVEEVWQFCSGFSSGTTEVSECEESEAEDLMALSLQAIKGTEGPKTLRLEGLLNNKKAYVLVDSGSSTCFINEQFAATITDWSLLASPLQVQVANGSTLWCTHQLLNQSWSVQGHEFTTSFKIVPLGTYDLILGMDWLSTHIMGSSISMQQLSSLDYHDAVLYSVLLQSENGQGNSSSVPEAIEQLLLEYSDLFSKPNSLPPPRRGDHTIPLVPGAQPFRLRPYRTYAVAHTAAAQDYELGRVLEDLPPSAFRLGNPDRRHHLLLRSDSSLPQGTSRLKRRPNNTAPGHKTLETPRRFSCSGEGNRGREATLNEAEKGMRVGTSYLSIKISTGKRKTVQLGREERGSGARQQPRRSGARRQPRPRRGALQRRQPRQQAARRGGSPVAGRLGMAGQRKVAWGCQTGHGGGEEREKREVGDGW